jgi:hypothetical protein
MRFLVLRRGINKTIIKGSKTLRSWRTVKNSDIEQITGGMFGDFLRN